MNTFRVLEINEPVYPYPFRSSKDAYKAVADWGRASREVFVALYLDNNNSIMASELIAVGSPSQSTVPISEVLRGALRVPGVSSIICAHNHPGGGLNPSESDLSTTAGLILACEAIGLHFLDHMILSRDSYYSMADSGDIPELRTKANKALSYMGVTT